MLGLQPNRAGFCKCPLHGEKTGSMKIYPGSRGWYCFGCHQGGSVIDLVMAYYGMDVTQAIALLNDEFGLGLPVGRAGTAEQEEAARKRAAEREAETRKRKEEEKERDEAFKRWLDISSEIMLLETWKTDFAPRGANDAFDERYVDAVNRLPILREEAEMLADRFLRREGE